MVSIFSFELRDEEVSRPKGLETSGLETNAKPLATSWSRDQDKTLAYRPMNGRRLRGWLGMVSPKIIEAEPPEGTAHASVLPIISRSSVIGCVAKYELTKKVS